MRVKLTGMKKVLLYFISRVHDWKSEVSAPVQLYVKGRVLAKDRVRVDEHFVYYRVRKDQLHSCH